MYTHKSHKELDTWIWEEKRSEERGIEDNSYPDIVF
jgi:hypothetical protein